MRFTKYLFYLLPFVLVSCWKYRNGPDDPSVQSTVKVMGYKPVYGDEPGAKKILYQPGARPVNSKGNIYAFQQYIFQIDPGLGIHVFDNAVPANARRVGFIQVKGCSQMSIKGNKIYTNSYDDLVVLDFSDLANIQEFSRLVGVFTEFRYGSPLAQPPGSGYYECPSSTKFITGWVQDSVLKSCFKN